MVKSKKNYTKKFVSDEEFDRFVGVTCSDRNSVFSKTEGCICKPKYADYGVGCRLAQPYHLLDKLMEILTV